MRIKNNDNKWYLLGLAALIALCFATIYIVHLADKTRQRECVERGGRVIEIQGMYARGGWICSD